MLYPFFHIIRWPNLLMVMAIQGILFFRLLHSDISILELQDLVLLALITVIIAASGYVINDYYDVNTDRINKPHQWIAGNRWTLRQVLMVYGMLVVVGACISIVLAIKLNLVPYLWIYPLAVLGLWFYSYALKCKPIAGNFWVALFCAGVILIVGTPDWVLQHREAIRPELLHYAIFAFLATWYREIVKDLEDAKGDMEINCRTLVVRYGERTGKIAAMATGLVLLASMIWWETTPSVHGVGFALTTLQGSMVASMAFVWFAKDQAHFHRASFVIKIMMLGGTLMLFLIN